MKQITSQTALDAYIEVVDEATKLSDRIAMFLADHGEVAPGDVNWSHAGSMNHVYDLLKQVVDFIGGDTDDADAAYDDAYDAAKAYAAAKAAYDDADAAYDDAYDAAKADAYDDAKVAAFAAAKAAYEDAYAAYEDAKAAYEDAYAADEALRDYDATIASFLAGTGRV